MTPDGRSRLFWPVVCLLLTYQSSVQVSSHFSESVTADEPVEIAAGYSYVTTGDLRMSIEHPPLYKMIAALPLLCFRLSTHVDSAAWRSNDEYAFGMEWFRANANQEEKILLAARLTVILQTVLLGLVIALWTRAAFGVPTALTALVLYAFDPTITAMGAYVKNDVPVALFAFLTCIAWRDYLTRPRALSLLRTGVILGLAIVTKFSALFLLPVLACLFAAWYLQKNASLSGQSGIISLIATVMIAGLVIFLTYRLPAWSHHSAGAVHSQSTHVKSLGEAFANDPFVIELSTLFMHNKVGHAAYLLGNLKTDGWWYYFPVAFMVKMPIATLIALALSAWIGFNKLRRTNLRRLPFDYLLLTIPIVIYAAIALTMRIDIGIRHLLPILPPLFILIAALLTRAEWRLVRVFLLPLLGLLLVIESLSIYPHYLAFFNLLAGGPTHGPRILADSNIDWGQDARHLAEWVRRNNIRDLCLDYWGNADLEHLGLSGKPLLTRIADGDPTDCVEAVSVNYLYGLYWNRGDFGWLRREPPDARIGYSIYIYDLARLSRTPGSPLFHRESPAFRSALHQDFRGELTPKDPAIPGEAVAFFMTGLGPVDPPVAQGQPAPLSPLSRTTLPLICRWEAGPSAEILFAGLAPLRTGIYQVNVRIPPELKTGQIRCFSPLSNSGGATTTIAIGSGRTNPGQTNRVGQF